MLFTDRIQQLIILHRKTVENLFYFIGKSQMFHSCIRREVHNNSQRTLQQDISNKRPIRKHQILLPGGKW